MRKPVPLLLQKEQGIKDIRDVNYKLNVKGIYIVPLKWEEEAVLIYVFRCRMLIEMLESENNNNLLKSMVMRTHRWAYVSEISG